MKILSVSHQYRPIQRYCWSIVSHEDTTRARMLLELLFQSGVFRFDRLVNIRLILCCTSDSMQWRSQGGFECGGSPNGRNSNAESRGGEGARCPIPKNLTTASTADYPSRRSVSRSVLRRWWIAFKQSVLVYKCLHRSAPAYLTDELCHGGTCRGSSATPFQFIFIIDCQPHPTPYCR